MFRWKGLGLIAALCSCAALAQAPAEQAPLKEIAVAPGAFVRGAPVPDWAELLPVPAPDPGHARRPLVVRLADSHLHAGTSMAYLVNRAEQANEASTLAQIGQATMAFNPQYQRLLLHRVLLLRGDQTIDHTATVPVRFLQRETGLEQGVYSGVITASLVLPDVRIGDTLHLVYTLEGDNPIFGRRFMNAASWDQAQFTAIRRVTLIAPADRPIAWRWLGGLGGDGPAPEAHAIGAMQRLRFEQRDMDGVTPEPYLPASAMPYRWLQFSEFRDWREVADWAATLFPAEAPLPAELMPEIERLRALPSDEERIAAALQWVQSQIRYYSVVLGESSHRPALPAEVVQRRFGDCKDKSLLLVQMLRALGLPAEPVLASLQTRSAPARQLPTPAAFDHVIVRVHAGGRDHYIDPTRLGQTGALAALGQHLEGAAVLPVHPGSAALVTITSPNRGQIFANQLSERFHLPAFGGAGVLEVESLWVGLAAENLRLALPSLDGARREQFALGNYERRYPGITLAGAPEFVDDPLGNRITIRARFQVPKLVQESPEAWVGRYFPANLQGSFAIPEQVASRRFPLVMPSWPATLSYQLEMRWPDSVAVVADPSTRRIDTPHFRLESARSFRGNVMRHSVTLQPLVSELPAAELPRLMDDLRRLDQTIGGTMAVAKSEVKSTGVLGLGRTSMQDKMRERLKTTIERSTKVIDAGKLGGEDLAGVLCTRAESASDLGDPAAGMKDAQDAVKAAPGFARALLCRGNLHWANGAFAKAAADYSAALAVADDPFEPIYRRGHARFYEGRLDQAAADFAKAATEQKDDAARLYMLLWQGFALLRQGQPLPPSLVEAASRQPDGDWPRPALAMVAGLRTIDEVLAQIDRRQQGDERELTLAEAWFYIGQVHLAQGRPGPAREAFEAARGKAITMYLEHVAAGFELARLPR